MIKTLAIQGQTIEYTQRTSGRGRVLRLAVYHDGRCVLTVPRRASEMMIENFLADKSAWILKKVQQFRERPRMMLGSGTKEEFTQCKQEAYEAILRRLLHFKEMYGVSWKNITVRNQSTRWGSCSKQGNLSFNYKLLHLPQELVDYIVVHELCHLKEMNHSQNFWNLVARAIPEYKQVRLRLRNL